MSAATVTADDLRRVRSRIEDPGRWTTGTCARKTDGNPCLSTDPAAAAWCLRGALLVEGIDGFPADQPVYSAAIYLYALIPIRVNDDLGHAAVLAVLDHAIAHLEREPGS